MTQTPNAPQPNDPFLDCQTLKSLERPRYFTGQLLTADDLKSEQDYIIAKQRLHHRYLHEQNVYIVAGLTVKRDNKDETGSIDIEPGYAINYCGNNIVVPQQATFGVIQQIRANATPYYQHMAWNPQRPAKPDLQRKYYWLTIAYDEQEVSPAPGLRTADPLRSPAMPNRTGDPLSPSPFTCEPTRIREWYHLDVIEALPVDNSGETIALEDALLTGDNHLILARITVEDNSIVAIENGVASRISKPQTAISDLQKQIASLQDTLLHVQKEIEQLRASAPPTDPRGTTKLEATENPEKE